MVSIIVFCVRSVIINVVIFAISGTNLIIIIPFKNTNRASLSLLFSLSLIAIIPDHYQHRQYRQHHHHHHPPPHHHYRRDWWLGVLANFVTVCVVPLVCCWKMFLTLTYHWLLQWQKPAEIKRSSFAFWVSLVVIPCMVFFKKPCKYFLLSSVFWSANSYEVWGFAIFLTCGWVSSATAVLVLKIGRVLVLLYCLFFAGKLEIGLYIENTFSCGKG